MISASTTRIFSAVMAGLTALWEPATPSPPSTPPPPPPLIHSVWNSWWPWLGVTLLGCFLCSVACILRTKNIPGRGRCKKGHPEVRKDVLGSGTGEEVSESRTGEVSKSPSISLELTDEEIIESVNMYKEKFRTMGIDIIGHGVLEYTTEIIGCGRYSRVYAVTRAWPGHRVNVPLCVKCIVNRKPSAIFQTCIEVMNVAMLSGVPGVPRVLAVCLKGPPLIVMTKHSKTTLDVLIHEGVVSDLFFLKVCYQLCVTLDFIHRRKRIHNDVKGNNICVDVKPGNHPKLTLIDYGLMTKDGERLFVAPTCERERIKATADHNRQYPWYDLELYLGGPASPQTDIYSVSVLLRQVVRAMRAPPAAVLACVKDGLGRPSQRPSLTRFKTVLQASISALSYKRL